MNRRTRRHSPEFIDELNDGQKNILPHDAIRNGRNVDDVFWNGPANNSRIQKIGVFVLGVTYLVCALALASICFQERSWFGLVVIALCAGVGLRLIYKSFAGRNAKR